MLKNTKAGGIELAEKVKVPCEVADVIKAAREKGYTNCGIVLATQFVPIKLDFEVIAQWMVDGDGKNDDRLLDALVNGYEVEPEYKVGDWVIYKGFEGKVTCKIIAIQYEHARVQFEGVSNWQAILDIVRHATPEEIKAEKERRVWAEIGRNLNQIKPGDVLITDDGPKLVEKHTGQVPYKRVYRSCANLILEGRVKGIHPAESFVSFEEGEDE